MTVPGGKLDNSLGGLFIRVRWQCGTETWFAHRLLRSKQKNGMEGSEKD